VPDFVMNLYWSLALIT